MRQLQPAQEQEDSAEEDFVEVKTAEKKKGGVKKK
jgi:hypothetical protein